MRIPGEQFLPEKLIVSFLVTPAVPAVIVACYLVPAYARKTIPDSLSVFGMIFLLGFVVASVHVLLLGVPAFLLGRRLHAIRWWTCISISFLIGGLPITLLTWQVSPPTGRQSLFLGWGLFGVSGGLVFWLLWHYWISQRERSDT